MYGFGDDQNPYSETVDPIEDLVVEYITELVSGNYSYKYKTPDPFSCVACYSLLTVGAGQKPRPLLASVDKTQLLILDVDCRM